MKLTVTVGGEEGGRIDKITTTTTIKMSGQERRRGWRAEMVSAKRSSSLNLQRISLPPATRPPIPPGPATKFKIIGIALTRDWEEPGPARPQARPPPREGRPRNKHKKRKKSQAAQSPGPPAAAATKEPIRPSRPFKVRNWWARGRTAPNKEASELLPSALQQQQQ